jgi:transposase
VWVPDETTFGRRELLHCYRKAVADHTAATNSLRDFLNGHAIRPGKRKLELESTRQWILAQRQDWSELQQSLLGDYYTNINFAKKRRQDLYQRIAVEVGAEPMMLRCMKLLGVGIVNAFALMAVIGDVRRFESPQKLVAYVGLNPGQRTSGNGKAIKVGVGRRGRGDLRRLLVQGAQAVLRMGKASAMGQWGWKLFARKGNRNVAVVAVARKLLVQVWHLLVGNPPTALESDKSLSAKLVKVALALGTKLRIQLGWGKTLAQCAQTLRERISQVAAAPCQSSPSVGALRPHAPALLAAGAGGLS